MSSLARGFLRSRLQPLASSSAAGTFQARSFSSRLLHQARHGANSSNWMRLGLGVVLAAFGQRLLVVPDVLGRAGAVEEEQVRRDAGVGREDAVGQADDGVQVELLEQFLLDAGADAVAEERAVGHDHGGARGRRLLSAARRSLRMMSCRKSSAVSAVCLSSGKLPWMPFSSSPPKGGLVRMTSTRSLSPISVSLKRRLLPGSICGESRPCSSRFIWQSR